MKTIDFACGSIEPIGLLEDLVRGGLQSQDLSALFSYGDPSGCMGLREELAKAHGRSPDEVIITSSAQQSLDIIFEALEGRADVVHLQEPAFFGSIRLLRKKLYDVIPFGDFEELKEDLDPKRISIVYLTSNFNSSIGGGLTEQEKKGLAGLVRGSQVLVIEDNPYDGLYFGEEPSTISSQASEESLYVGSFSKILAPGLRIGYVIAPEGLIRGLRSAKIDRDIFTSPLSQSVCLHAMRESRYLPGLRQEFKARRDAALGCIADLFSSQASVSWGTPGGGIFLTVDFGGIPMDRLLSAAKQDYCLVLEQDRFKYFDGVSRGTTRINYAGNSVGSIREGIERLYHAYMEVKDDEK